MAERHGDRDRDAGLTPPIMQVFITRSVALLIGVAGFCFTVLLAVCGWFGAHWMDRMERDYLELALLAKQRADVPYRLTQAEARITEHARDIQDLKEWQWQRASKR